MFLNWSTLSTCLLALVTLASPVAHSDEEMSTTKETITMPLADKPRSDIDRPTRGQSQQSVQNSYGDPIKRHPARGKPPISKWEYSEFTVIFESGYVIHTVIKNKR